MKLPNMDTPLEIRARTETRTASGDTVSGWTKLADVWGMVATPWSGLRERTDATLSRQFQTQVITVRWTPDLAPPTDITAREIRNVQTGQRYRINVVSDTGSRDSYLQLTCELITQEDR